MGNNSTSATDTEMFLEGLKECETQEDVLSITEDIDKIDYSEFETIRMHTPNTESARVIHDADIEIVNGPRGYNRFKGFDPFTMQDVSEFGYDQSPRIPAISEVYDAYEMKVLLHSGNLYPAPYADLRRYNSISAEEIDIRVDETALVDVMTAIDAAIERAQNVEDMLLNKIEHRKPVTGMVSGLTYIRHKLMSNSSETVKCPVRDVMALLGLGVGLELVDIDGAVRQYEDDESAPYNTVKGVVTYEGHYTALMEQYDRGEREAEYDKYHQQEKWLFEVLEGASAVLSTEPLCGHEDRAWGS